MIGEHLQKMIKERNLNLTKLSKASGLSVGLLSNLKLDKSEPSVKVLEKLADVLICSTDELLGRS